MTETEKPAQPRTALLIDVLYAVAIGINVWILLDQMTGGELSREARAFATGITENAKAKRKARRQLKHDEFEVVQQAADILKESGK